jgi:GT2 family glycosyltransferase
MSGRVTAIVSAYYASEYLEGRLQNLFDQSEKPEIIVICQKDSKEADICEVFDVDTIMTENIPSIYEAWNMGIKASKTKYVTNANSDDRLAKDALKRACDSLDNNKDFGVCYFDVEVCETLGGNPVETYNWIEGGLEQLKKGCFIGPMPVWKKELNEKLGYFDERFLVCGDYELWLRFASRGVKFYHMRSEPLGMYFRRYNSAEHREPLRSMWETKKIQGMYRGA